MRGSGCTAHAGQLAWQRRSPGTVQHGTTVICVIWASLQINLDVAPEKRIRRKSKILRTQIVTSLLKHKPATPQAPLLPQAAAFATPLITPGAIVVTARRARLTEHVTHTGVLNRCVCCTRLANLPAEVSMHAQLRVREGVHVANKLSVLPALVTGPAGTDRCDQPWQLRFQGSLYQNRPRVRLVSNQMLVSCSRLRARRATQSPTIGSVSPLFTCTACGRVSSPPASTKPLHRPPQSQRLLWPAHHTG